MRTLLQTALSIHLSRPLPGSLSGLIRLGGGAIKPSGAMEGGVAAEVVYWHRQRSGGGEKKRRGLLWLVLLVCVCLCVRLCVYEGAHVHELAYTVYVCLFACWKSTGIAFTCMSAYWWSVQVVERWYLYAQTGLMEILSTAHAYQYPPP